MYLTSQTHNVFAPAATPYITERLGTQHTLARDSIRALLRFYLETPGNEKLLGRVTNLAQNLRHNAVNAIFIRSESDIIASSVLYRHDNNIGEIGSVLIHPNFKGRGLYAQLRQAHIAETNHQALLMFERLDPLKKRDILAQRALEGWCELPFLDPLFQHIETTKPLDRTQTIPKTGLIYR